MSRPGPRNWRVMGLAAAVVVLATACATTYWVAYSVGRMDAARDSGVVADQYRRRFSADIAMGLPVESSDRLLERAVGAIEASAAALGHPYPNPTPLLRPASHHRSDQLFPRRTR